MKKEISEIWSVDELPDANRVEYKGDLDEYFNEANSKEDVYVINYYLRHLMLLVYTIYKLF